MHRDYPSFVEQTAKTTAILQSTWQVNPASIRHVVAPYRICPLGAHVDHQGGHVLGRTINIGTVLSFAPIEGPHVRLLSTAFDTAANFTIGDAVDMIDWARYAQAAALALHAGVIPGSGRSPAETTLDFRTEGSKAKLTTVLHHALTCGGQSLSLVLTRS